VTLHCTQKAYRGHGGETLRVIHPGITSCLVYSSADLLLGEKTGTVLSSNLESCEEVPISEEPGRGIEKV
jgi:hypothetical protein